MPEGQDTYLEAGGEGVLATSRGEKEDTGRKDDKTRMI